MTTATQELPTAELRAISDEAFAKYSELASAIVRDHLFTAARPAETIRTVGDLTVGQMVACFDIDSRHGGDRYARRRLLESGTWEGGEFPRGGVYLVTAVTAKSIRVSMVPRSAGGYSIGPRDFASVLRPEGPSAWVSSYQFRDSGSREWVVLGDFAAIEAEMQADERLSALGVLWQDAEEKAAAWTAASQAEMAVWQASVDEAEREVARLNAITGCRVFERAYSNTITTKIPAEVVQALLEARDSAGFIHGFEMADVQQAMKQIAKQR